VRTSSNPSAADSIQSVPLVDLFLQFLIVGAVSFGGGIIAYERILLVEKRKWLNADQFMAYLAISQTMPGLNSVNLAVLTGDYLRGIKGSIIALLGLVLPGSALSSLAGLCLYRTNRSRHYGFVINGHCGWRYWSTGGSYVSDW
jgi:chromate transporter